MAQIPLTLDDVRDPQRLFYVLRQFNNMLGAQTVLAKPAPVAASAPTQQQLDSIADAVRSRIGASGSHPLNITGLPGQAAEAQPAALLIFTADPTTTSTLSADRYDVGTMATYNGAFYYVKAGNPHTWSALTLASPSNMVTTDTVQNIGTGAAKTFKDLTTFDKSTGAVLIKPTAPPGANTKMFDMQTSAAASNFSVNETGDTVANKITISTTASVGTNLTVTGTTGLTGLLTAVDGTFTGKLGVGGATGTEKLKVTGNTEITGTVVSYNGTTPATTLAFPYLVARNLYTAQAASQALTTLYTPAALGDYRVNYYMTCTTAGAASSALVSILWVDDSTATISVNSNVCSLTALGGAVFDSFPIRAAASSNIQFSTTYAGAAAAKYLLVLWLERIT